MLTADTSLTTGVEAMRHGAYDYLTKPATLDEMETVIRKADEKRRLLKQNASLRSVARPAVGIDEVLPIVYENPVMAGLVAQGKTAARTDSTVLLTGESGTGKDVLARYIHSQSPRQNMPLITVNCGALPETLFESEFFGHERGAFTGATSLRRGLLEAADGSTLFLDEIGDLPLVMQVKLLHFLEQGRFRRVGSTRDQNADVRVIAATNRNLPEEVEHQRFRADLFYRLNVVSLHVPPLRDRPEDIPGLMEYFLDIYRKRFVRPRLDLSEEVRLLLAGQCARVAQLPRTRSRDLSERYHRSQSNPFPQLRARRSRGQQFSSGGGCGPANSSGYFGRTRTGTHPAGTQRERWQPRTHGRYSRHLFTHPLSQAARVRNPDHIRRVGHRRLR
jgi:DNA-binding NtrC family response regulator